MEAYIPYSQVGQQVKTLSSNPQGKAARAREAELVNNFDTAFSSSNPKESKDL